MSNNNLLKKNKFFFFRLEPLLKRIGEKKNAIVCPSIDLISASDMSYSGNQQIKSIGGFLWSLHFRWDYLPEKIALKRKSEIEPIP